MNGLSSTPPRLEVANLSVTLRTRAGHAIRPVRDVSFDLHPGRTLGVVGESGSGKSSLALAISKLHSPLVDAAFSGSVSFGGRNLLTLSESKLRAIRGASIGYVFQSPEAALDPTRRVGSQIVQVIRAHRLWERYLADEARMALTDVHAEAERREHAHSTEALQALADAMGHPVTDPHGDPIPTAQGQLARPVVQPVTAWPLHLPARIVHLEDEPQAVFAQIAAEGLRPGQVVRVLEANARRMILSDGERTHTLAPVVAANIFVCPEVRQVETPSARRLTALRRGQRAIVRELDESLQGFTRRRLLDLGLTPGTPITAELPSPFGDPVAYRVRGTLIALRRDQAESILITTDHGVDHD